jgi:hypothetical protein
MPVQYHVNSGRKSANDRVIRAINPDNSIVGLRYMKSFWITYSIATLALLAFCYSFLGVLPLCGAVTVGAVVSTAWLFRKRTALAAQKHLVGIALLASFASVASGFILIFAVGFIGESFR